MQQNELKKKVKELVGVSNAKRLFLAIKKGIPIIVCERNTENRIDGELYRALKALGAKEVYNYELVMEHKKKVRGVFCAVFNEGQL